MRSSRAKGRQTGCGLRAGSGTGVSYGLASRAVGTLLSRHLAFAHTLCPPYVCMELLLRSVHRACEPVANSRCCSPLGRQALRSHTHPRLHDREVELLILRDPASLLAVPSLQRSNKALRWVGVAPVKREEKVTPRAGVSKSKSSMPWEWGGGWTERGPERSPPERSPLQLQLISSAPLVVSQLPLAQL